MPHIHLEYSDNIDTLEVKPILLALNQALLDGQFVQSGNDIKSRAIRQSDFVIGVEGDAQAYLHAVLVFQRLNVFSKWLKNKNGVQLTPF